MPVPTHGLTEKMLQIERRVTEKNQLQAVTCDHTQYGGYSVIQRRRLVIVFLHLDKEVASKTATSHIREMLIQLRKKHLINTK